MSCNLIRGHNSAYNSYCPFKCHIPRTGKYGESCVLIGYSSGLDTDLPLNSENCPHLPSPPNSQINSVWAYMWELPSHTKKLFAFGIIPDKRDVPDVVGRYPVWNYHFRSRSQLTFESFFSLNYLFREI